MSKTPLVIFGIFAAICLIAVPLIALDKEGAKSSAPVTVAERDEDGRELFADNCGPCHTLAAAGTDGVVGPNLDQTLAPGGVATYEGSYGRTINAVACGFGGGRMPAGILTGENAKEVAAFVGAYAGQVGADAEPLADTETADKPDPPDCGAGEAGSDPGSSAAPESGTEPSGATESGA